MQVNKITSLPFRDQDTWRMRVNVDAYFSAPRNQHPRADSKTPSAADKAGAIQLGFIRAQAIIKSVTGMLSSIESIDTNAEVIQALSALFAAEAALDKLVRQTERDSRPRADIEGLQFDANNVAGIVHLASKVLWDEADASTCTDQLAYASAALDASEDLLSDHAEMIGQAAREAA